MAYAAVHTQNYSADTSALWENTASPYTTPTDPDFPFISESQRADLVTAAGPAGENIVSFTTNAGYQSYNGYGPFDATCGRATLDAMVTTANATAMGTSQFKHLFGLKSSPNVASTGNITVMFKAASIVGSTMTGTWRLLYNNLVTTDVAGTVTLDAWYSYALTWTCGSNPAEVSLSVVPTANSDGRITLTSTPSAGGIVSTLFALTNIPLYTGPGTVFSGGIGGYSALNENDNFQVSGWGKFTNVVISRCADGIIGSMVAGVKTTVNVTRAIAFGLDDNTNVHDTEGMFKVFGDVEITGELTVGSTTIGGGGSIDISDLLDALGT